MHKDIRTQDYSNGWFSQHERCCRGEDILNWLTEKVSNDQKRVQIYCQKMLDQNIIHNVEEKNFFCKSDLYQF